VRLGSDKLTHSSNKLNQQVDWNVVTYTSWPFTCSRNSISVDKWKLIDRCCSRMGSVEKPSAGKWCMIQNYIHHYMPAYYLNLLGWIQSCLALRFNYTNYSAMKTENLPRFFSAGATTGISNISSTVLVVCRSFPLAIFQHLFSSLTCSPSSAARLHHRKWYTCTVSMANGHLLNQTWVTW